MLVVAIPGLGARAIQAGKSEPELLVGLRDLVGGPPMRCITPYSRSHSVYLWVNEEAKEELLTRNFVVGTTFASNPLFGSVVFTSWDGKQPQLLSNDQVQFILDKLVARG